MGVSRANQNAHTPKQNKTNLKTASGAVACQLLDALHPGLIPIKKVNANAVSEYDMIGNYKVLQEAFTKLGLDKRIDVAKLVKAR